MTIDLLVLTETHSARPCDRSKGCGNDFHGGCCSGSSGTTTEGSEAFECIYQWRLLLKSSK